MRRARAFSVGFGLLALLVGCQGPQREPVKASGDTLSLAREAMEMGDYARAATLLREAVVSSPDNVEAHYRLAVSANLQVDIARNPRASVDSTIETAWDARGNLISPFAAPV